MIVGAQASQNPAYMLNHPIYRTADGKGWEKIWQINSITVTQLPLKSIRIMRNAQKPYSIPLKQLVGYILSEDPTYITNYNNARALIRKLDREALLKTLIKSFLDI